MAASTEVDQFQPHYYPNDAAQFWERRTLRRNESPCKDPTGSFLEGLPARVDSVLSWDGSALKSTDYVFQLNEAHLEEIERACAEFLSLSPVLRLLMWLSANDLENPVENCVKFGERPSIYHCWLRP